MPNIKEIVNRMHSVSSMRQITKTMKLIAASKFNRAQQNLFKVRHYEQFIEDMRDKILGDVNETNIKKFCSREKKDNLLLVVCTADKGFCGSFNNATIKKALEQFNVQKEVFKKITVLPIGRKAYMHFKKNDFEIVEEFNDIIAKLDQDKICDFSQWLIQNFLDETYDEIVFVYNKFKNAASQTITTRTFLPMNIVVEEKLFPEEFIFEPSKGEVIDAFIPFFLQTDLTRILFESNASEQGARMTSMTKATDNADALIKALRIQYNQSRQATITNEIIEISAGANAIK